ncbi:tyrosine-type recombinase/integrase [Enterococcus casseliflavus]|uniref:tyrosine-type recombinase/integrase n=1 Tax=Enterococcus casseliflavus TaxID=37734 RepID=UPI003D6A0E32
MEKSTINRILRRCVRLTHVKEIQPKELRHYHFSLLMNELNANSVAAQKFHGHSDLQITIGIYL